MIKIAQFIVIFFLLVSCHADIQDSKQSGLGITDNSTSNWTIILDMSGGFTGQMYRLTLDDTGEAILHNKKTKSQVEKRITPQNLHSYANLARLLPVKNKIAHDFSQCRDCITYDLVVIIDNLIKHRVTSDAHLMDSDGKELIQALTSLAVKMRK